MSLKWKFYLASTAVIAAGIGAAWWVGLRPQHATEQVTDVAMDLLAPATDFRAQQARREALRGELERVAAFQLRHHDAHGQLARPDSVPGLGDPFRLHLERYTPARRYQDAQGPGPQQAAWMTHLESPEGEFCAVTFGTEPGEILGVPLKRRGEVRCSWDLATKVNQVM